MNKIKAIVNRIAPDNEVTLYDKKGNILQTTDKELARRRTLREETDYQMLKAASEKNSYYKEIGIALIIFGISLGAPITILIIRLLGL